LLRFDMPFPFLFSRAAIVRLWRYGMTDPIKVSFEFYRFIKNKQTNPGATKNTTVSLFGLTLSIFFATMAPRPRSFHLDDDADVTSDVHDGFKSIVSLGFTSEIMDTIRASKVKINEWVEREKEKADAMAESYHQRLQEEQASIDRKAEELRMIKKERGMISQHSCSNNDNDNDDGDNLPARKQALEEQAIQLEVEIMKLQTQRKNREERVKGMFLTIIYV
jgi:hypothetical protein